jgi:hypothetical protein
VNGDGEFFLRLEFHLQARDHHRKICANSTAVTLRSMTVRLQPPCPAIEA